MYFPRVQAFDRLRGRVEMFGSCGAAAGMIARSDETWPVWSAAESEEAILRPGLRPATVVNEAERVRLSQAGVNTLVSVRGGARTAVSPRTLAAGGSGASDWKYLSARRLALFVAASIEQGTRWVTLEHNGPATWERARLQVEAFLEELAAQGAFAGAAAEESHFVISRRARQPPRDAGRGQVQPAVRLCHQQARRLRYLAGHPPRRREPRAPGVGQSLGDLEESRRVGDRDRDPARLGNPLGLAPKPPPPGVRIVSSSPGNYLEARRRPQSLHRAAGAADERRAAPRGLPPSTPKGAMRR